MKATLFRLELGGHSHFSRTILVVVSAGLALVIPGLSAQSPDDPNELVKGARKATAAGKYDEALALYDKAVKLDPKSYEAYLGAGFALDLKADYAEARRRLARAIELATDETKSQALTAMAVSFAFEANAPEAAKYYEQVFDRALVAGRYDAAAETANALGRVYLESGDIDSAAKWYQTGHEQADRLSGLPRDQIDLWTMRWMHARARLAARRGRHEEARQLANELKALVDKGNANAEQRPIYQYLAGYLAFYRGDYDVAIGELLKGDTKDVFIIGLIARSYDQKGDLTNARIYYEKALQSSAHNINNAFTRPFARARMKALARRVPSLGQLGSGVKSVYRGAR
ncbi:MAG: tetratricopeptide repeat protein [Acidobacteria bacterium]|nr:tetratricopeptide repeat protein [Acidobacteriota bacterium]